MFQLQQSLIHWNQYIALTRKALYTTLAEFANTENPDEVAN